jgi:hypothetical protein
MTELEAKQLEYRYPNILEIVQTNSISKSYVAIVGKGDNEWVHSEYTEAIARAERLKNEYLKETQND